MVGQLNRANTSGARSFANELRNARTEASGIPEWSRKVLDKKPPKASAAARHAPALNAAAAIASPVLENNGNWQEILNSGFHQGQPVYVHYTSEAGLAAIRASGAISDVARGERRAGAQAGIYVNPPGQQFNPENAENLLFLGNERYIGSANHMVVFSSDQPVNNLGPVTAGSPVQEIRTTQSTIPLNAQNFLYGGVNSFPDWFGS